MGALALCSADLREFDGEARVQDLRLGEVLGFDRPRDVRKIIQRNEAELVRYGLVCAAMAQTLSRRGRAEGRPTKEYHLNEAQALLICMFSETHRAADAREQIIRVFLAWRHGHLVEDRQWAAMERRIAQLEKLIKSQMLAETTGFSRAVTHAPSIFSLRHQDGRRRVQRRYRWWGDMAVREAVIRRHRQMTLDCALAEISEEFGVERAPGRTSMHRFWQRLDTARLPS
jgi:hypothetical protein